MEKIRALIVVAAVAAFGTFASQASAKVHWAGNSYHLESGQNGFLNHKVELFFSEGKGENRAVCAGIREIESNCVGRGSFALYTLPFYVIGEPYLHNHDTEGGFFNGWYE